MTKHRVSLHKGLLGLLVAVFALVNLPLRAHATAHATVTAQEVAAQEVAAQEVAAQEVAAQEQATADDGAEPLALSTEPAPRRSPNALKPPLPFNNPQVGPVIHRGDQDDVDLRTTAFIPSAAVLERLTPHEFPEGEARWIRIDLSEQLLLAYEGDRIVRAFVVSTGRAQTPTVTGEFRIRMKVRTQTMTGGSTALGTYYNLPNVQWVQYFYADYGIHGTYWHNNFGQPMSHGCVNMTNADAKWLFDWAGPEWDESTVWFPSTTDNPGTLVIVHE